MKKKIIIASLIVVWILSIVGAWTLGAWQMNGYDRTHYWMSKKSNADVEYTKKLMREK